MKSKMNMNIDGAQEIQEIRSTTVNYALVTIAVLAIPALIASLLRTVDIGWQNVFYLHIGMIVIVWITAGLRHKLPFQFRSLILLAVILTLGIAALISFGLLGAGKLFLMTFCILTASLYGFRGVFASLMLSFIVITAIGLGVQSGAIIFTVDANVYQMAPTNWIILAVAMVLFTGMVSSVTGIMNYKLVNSINGWRNSAEELQASRNLLQTVFDAIPHSIVVKDREGRYVTVNSKFSEIVNLQNKDIEGRTLSQLGIGTEEQLQVHIAMDQEVIKTGKKIESKEVVSITSPGDEVRWLKISKIPFQGKDGILMGVVGISEDITESKQAGENLRESEEKFRNLVESSLQGIFIHRNFKPLFVNNAYAQMFGFESPEEVLHLESFRSLIHPEDFSKLIDSAKKEKEIDEHPHQYRGVRKDGEIIYLVTQVMDIMWDGELARMGTIIDLSEGKKMEEQLRQAQKMEAIGQMAGGVAHDFNNMLHIIEGYAQLALGSLQGNKKRNIEKDLEKILQASHSASDITGQLLAFSRRHVLSLTGLDVNGVIGTLMKMLARLIGENVDLKVLPGENIGFIQGDRGLLEQVLMNLCVNARDAMPNGGRLVIETTRFQADEDFCANHDWSKPGDYIEISVSDTGGGISKENIQRIFEPFFTTKESGKGTGLGLSVVYGIVQQHDGHISVDSEIGVGTTFKIFLPKSGDTMDMTLLQGAKQVVGGNETILVAEDDPAVLELMVGALKDMGYRVLTAKDGIDACELYDAHTDSIDLALLDVIMPNMGGRAVYEHIHQVKPSLRVLFSTGYTANAIDSEFLAETGLKLLQKPYSPSTLLIAVREALDENP